MKKKLMACLLVLGLLVCMLPIASFAADENSMQSNGYTRLSDREAFSVWTKGDGTGSPSLWSWTAENGSYSSGNRNVKNSLSTLAILSKIDGILKFDWVIGSVSKFGYFAYRLNNDYLGAAAVTGQSDHKYTGDDSGSEDGIQVHSGDVLYLTFYKSNFDRHDILKDGATVSNIRIVQNGTVSVLSSDTSLGTVSWDLGSLENLTAGTVLTVTATEVNGQFAGWYETIGASTRLISTSAVFAYTVSEDATLEAQFIPIALNTIATWGENEYDDLQTALTAAGGAGSAAMVILQKNTTVADLIIPTNVTLLIPYSDDDTGVDFNDTQALTATAKKGIAYRTLTVNGNMTVNGTILVNARLGSSDTGHQGSIAGNYGHLVLDGTATVNSGGAFKVLGMVTGTGSIDTRSGAALYQPFEMTDWPGGTTGLGLYSEGNEFPINQYYIQNIQVTTTLEYGSSMNAYAYLLVPSSKLGVQVTMEGLIGTSNSAFFKMGEGSSLTLDYAAETCQTELTVEGTVALQAFSINAVGQSISTAGVTCPIPDGFDITLAPGASVTVVNDFKLLPGTAINVEEGATLTVAEGATIEVYGAEDFEPFYGSYPSLPNSSTVSSVGPIEGAQVTVAGTLINNGTVKVSDTEDDLLNITGTGTQTGTGTVIEVAVGKVVVHFDANGGAGTMSDQRLTYGMSGQLSANEFTRDGYTFVGWSASPLAQYNPLDGSDSVVNDAVSFSILPNVGIDAMTLYAWWQKDPSIVTFDSDGGSTVDPQTIEEGGTATRPADPTKEGFTFVGWFYGDPATEFDFTTVITDSITLTAHWTEIVVAPTLTLEGNFVNSTGSVTPATITITDAAAGTFTVECSKACVVAVDNGDGTYIRLTATNDSGNIYSFTAPARFATDISIVVVLRGDMDGNGAINALDAGRAKSASISKFSPTALGLLACDVNNNGKIDALEAGRIKSASISKYVFTW